MRHFQPVLLMLCLGYPAVLPAQETTGNPASVDDAAAPEDSREIDAGDLHGNRASEDADTTLQGDDAGLTQSRDDTTGWSSSHSETGTSSSSTSITVGNGQDQAGGFARPVRDDRYLEATLAGRWQLQGDNASCTVTLTATRWGNSGYRFNGPAGCPGSFIGGVSWAVEGGKLVVRAPVSPLGSFRERAPNRWEGRDNDGNRLSLTR